MSSIKSCISEINEIDIELKRTQEHAKKLRAHKKKLEQQIQEYMKETENPGFRVGSTAVVLQKQTRRNRKPKKETFEDVKSTLQSAGIYDDDLVKKLIDQTRGKEVEKASLKIVRK